jgi:phospholipid transport system substrate-binding protein
MDLYTVELTFIRRVVRSYVVAASLAVAIVAAALATAVPVRASNDPAVVVHGLVDQALGVLRNNQMPLAQKQERLRALVAQSFDFTEMSRSALGYHWRSLTPTQRADFIQIFTQFIEDSYLSKITEYKGQSVAFTKTVQLAPGYTQVGSKVLQPDGGEPISLDYRLKLENGEWRIYDVTVDAISIIANYRNQFNRVINDRGFPTLMSDLRAKSRQLASSVGQSASGR